ncbi:helix-turn-helix transcriptional regulator [Pontibacter sp. MBLB2868]|uniref:helix-turn-helix transcriptional regulator n=1 Tax=Pontibacter sp. MBLB2868 TaxID=3451555 RepID=UPI003F74DFE3
MIKNEQQYRLTKAQAAKFTESIDELLSGIEGKNMHPIQFKAYQDALQSQLDEMLEDIASYEALKQGRVRTIRVNSFDELPIALIKARIASGLTQKDLAEILGIKEQQVQRYEDTSYEGASFRRLKEIAQALQLKIKEDVFVSEDLISKSTMFSNLAKIGFKKEFVLNRLLPQNLALQLSGSIHASKDKVLQAASVISRILNVDVEKLLTGYDLNLDITQVYQTRFKKPSNAKIEKIAPYTIYAQMVAMILLEACKHLTRKEIPEDYIAFRNQIIHRYNVINFETALQYTWDLGIPVLPLSDSSYFHGACWRVDFKNVIVLKQKTNSGTRWLYDLIHEVRHAAQHPDNPSLNFIESNDDFNEEMVLSKDEKDANIFAGQVLLNGKANELSRRAITEVNGYLPKLKAKVVEVANNEGVDSGALANYIAFRLMAEQRVNWWGVATNLQSDQGGHWEIASNLLLKNAKLDVLSDIDKEILINALRKV